MRIGAISRICETKASAVEAVSWYEHSHRLEHVGRVQEASRNFPRVMEDLEHNPERRQYRTIEVVYAKGFRGSRKVRL